MTRNWYGCRKGPLAPHRAFAIESAYEEGLGVADSRAVICSTVEQYPLRFSTFGCCGAVTQQKPILNKDKK